MPEQIPIPEKLVSWFDIAKGVGEVVFHEIFDRHHHESIADHNLNYPENKTHPYDYDGIEKPPGW